MKNKLSILLLILTSLLAYLEWGQTNSSFLFQVEVELFQKLFTDPISVLHPFTLVPFGGQVLLLITLFQKEPNRIMVFSGIACLGLLLGLIFIIGIMGLNLKIILSTLPFIGSAVFAIRTYRKWQNKLMS